MKKAKDLLNIEVYEERKNISRCGSACSEPPGDLHWWGLKTFRRGSPTLDHPQSGRIFHQTVPSNRK